MADEAQHGRVLEPDQQHPGTAARRRSVLRPPSRGLLNSGLQTRALNLKPPRGRSLLSPARVVPWTAYPRIVIPSTNHRKSQSTRRTTSESLTRPNLTRHRRPLRRDRCPVPLGSASPPPESLNKTGRSISKPSNIGQRPFSGNRGGTRFLHAR